MRYSWNYRSQAKPRVYLSQKFWLILGSLQFFLLLGVYSSIILYLALLLIGLYGIYSIYHWLSFNRNVINKLSVYYVDTIEFNETVALSVHLEQYQLKQAFLKLEFEPHLALQKKQLDRGFVSDISENTHPLLATKLGGFKVPQILIRIKDRLNIFEKQMVLHSEDQFEVLPNSKSENAQEVLQLLKSDPNAMVWKNRQSLVRKSDLIVGAREYRPGDPLKLIDAKKTRRLQTPFVKVFEQDEAQHLEIILDVGRSMIGEIEGSQKVDFYTLLAYQLVRYTCSLGDTFSFASLSSSFEQYIYTSRKSEDFIDVYRNNKINVQSSDAKLELAVNHIKKLNKPSVVFFLLDMLKPSMHDAIVRLLPQLNPKHKIIVLHVTEEQYAVEKIVAQQIERSSTVSLEDRRRLVYALSLQERKQDLMAKLSNTNVSLIDLPTGHAVGLVRELYKQLRT